MPIESTLAKAQQTSTLRANASLDTIMAWSLNQEAEEDLKIA
jgi:hypothetical protein